jgi:hypothetical protein
MSTRAVAVLAMFGGAGWAIWPIPQALSGRDWPADSAVSLLLLVSVVIGTWALAGALIGLVFSFQDRIRWGAAALGSVGALAGAVSVTGLYGAIVALPIGSAVLAWELGRAGGLSTGLSRAHIVTAIIIVVLFAAYFANPALYDDRATAVPLMTLILPYAFSWIAIGWSLRHAEAIAEGGLRGTPARST